MLFELLTYILTFKICIYQKNIFPDGITEGKFDFPVGISPKFKHFYSALPIY